MNYRITVDGNVINIIISGVIITDYKPELVEYFRFPGKVDKTFAELAIGYWPEIKTQIMKVWHKGVKLVYSGEGVNGSVAVLLARISWGEIGGQSASAITLNAPYVGDWKFAYSWNSIDYVRHEIIKIKRHKGYKRVGVRCPRHNLMGRILEWFN